MNPEVVPYIVTGIVVGVLCFALGIFVGRKTVLSKMLDVATSLRNSALSYKRAFEDESARANRAIDFNSSLRKDAKRVHDALGCKNGDEWTDHTEEHPEGLTPKRRAQLEKAEKARVAAIEKARKAKQDELLALGGNKSTRGKDGSPNPNYNPSYNDIAYVAPVMIAADTSSFSGGDFGGGSVDCGSVSVDCGGF